jgi:YegS/Rv2252/BmrU family lipid kinase
MPARRVLLITNPASRRGTRRHDATVAVMRRAGVTVDDVVTTAAGEGGEIARARARDYDAVFTLGGDGTAMEVLAALAGTGCPVGVLPGGTGNQIARLLEIPLRPAAAAASLLAGEIARIDLGRLGDGRRFTIACGVGADASMIERTPLWLKRGIGVSAYVITAATNTLRHDPFDVRATVDGERIERRAIAAFVANFGAVLHAKLPFGPDITPDDGRLDLCVFSPSSVADTARLTWKLICRQFEDERRLTYRQGRRITIETTPSRVFQMDGDLAGTTPFGVEVEPRAATLLVPRAPHHASR